MILRKIYQVALLILIFGTSFAADQLPLPKNLISFNSAAGEILLKKSKSNNSYWSLMPYFTTEKGLTWCAVASDVMALNALNFSPPLTPQHAPYRIFSQDNFFNKKTIEVITPSQVNARGITLEQNAKLLEDYHASIRIVFSNNISEKQFRQVAINSVSSKNKIILINFCRKYINEKGCGHFSPLAAYNDQTDRFLLLDVARYKYPPVWIKTKDLYKAMSTGLDSTSNKHRGYLVVSR